MKATRSIAYASFILGTVFFLFSCSEKRDGEEFELRARGIQGQFTRFLFFRRKRPLVFYRKIILHYQEILRPLSLPIP